DRRPPPPHRHPLHICAGCGARDLQDLQLLVVCGAADGGRAADGRSCRGGEIGGMTTNQRHMRGLRIYKLELTRPVTPSTTPRTSPSSTAAMKERLNSCGCDEFLGGYLSPAFHNQVYLSCQ